jgi:hypothetical protein
LIIKIVLPRQEKGGVVVSSAISEMSVVELPGAELLEHLRSPDVVDVVLAAVVDVGRRVERLVGQILDVHHLDGDVVADAGVFEQLRHLRTSG